MLHGMSWHAGQLLRQLLAESALFGLSESAIASELDPRLILQLPYIFQPLPQAHSDKLHSSALHIGSPQTAQVISLKQLAWSPFDNGLT